MRPAKKFKQRAFFALLIAGSACALYFATTLPMPDPKHPIRFYSNHSRHDLRRLYIQALKGAKHSITASIYALTDPALIQLLEQKAKNGVEITLHVDPKATSLPPSLAQRCTLLPYTGKGLMHRKLLIVDNKRLFVGSANWTPTSLSMHDNLVIGIYHLQDTTHFDLPNQSGTLLLLPEANPTALETLIEQINEAKKSIRLAVFTLTHPLLLNALIEAHNRGVAVTCALDHYTAGGASKKGQEALQQAGIPVLFSRGQQLFHHKWVVIDDKKLIMGSANWTRAAFSKNSDCLFLLSSLTKEQRKYMRKIWRIIQLESTPEG